MDELLCDHGKGLSLSLTYKRDVVEGEERGRLLDIRDVEPTAERIKVGRTEETYRLPNDLKSNSNLLLELLRLLEEAKHVESFQVDRATLEQVFISLVDEANEREHSG